MKNDEEAFERGRPETPSEPKKRKKVVSKGHEGEKKRKTKREADDVTDDEQKLSSRVRRLATSHFREGSLVMAAVRDVNEEELTLNLPYNVLAYVQRSEAAEGDLAELYSPGQLVVAVILTALEVGHSERKKIRLEASLRPRLLNAGLTLETLRPKMCLPATVLSEEEHVLGVDFGEVKGIIKKKEFRSQGLELPAVGRIIMVSVQSVGSTVKCSLSFEEFEKAELSGQDWLKPGFLVAGRVKSVENDGLVVTFEGLTAVIHKHQLPDTEEEWSKNQKIVARVLAILPQPYPVIQLTLLPHLVGWKSEEQSTPVGELLVGEVLDFQNKYGCRVRCEDKMGFCPMSKLTDEGKDPVAASVASGFQAQYRVLGFNFLDSTLHLTRRPADLEDGVLVSVAELSPGQLVKGTVSTIADHGIRVKLSSYVQGQVHLRQLTDVPLATVPKRLQLGSKIKCRVLHVHKARRQLTLTAKKSLVKSEFQLTRNIDAKFSQLLTGYVSSIHDYGAIVSFYGGARGLIPKKDMEAEEAPALGMAVTCRVVHVDRKLDRLTCSLNLENGRTAAEIEAENTSKAKAITDSVVTDIKAVYAGSDGIVVKFKNFQKEEHLGYILPGHFSDDMEIAQKRFKELSQQLPQGDLKKASESKTKVKLLDRGLVLMKHYIPGFKQDDKGPGFALLSLKASLLQAWDAGCFVTKASDLQEGRFYSGYVREVKEFGATICLGTQRITAFAHKFELSRRFVEDPHEVVSEGQSVRAMVRKIDEKGIEVDLRPALCNDKKLLAREAEALRLSLLQRDWGENLEKKGKGFRPGSVVQGEVTKVESYGLVLSVKGHTAVALKENMPEMKNAELGSVLRCVVLDYNADTGILDVSLHPELLERHGKPEKGMEVQVLLALYKKSYCVCWSAKPPAVVFAPPYALSTWKYPISTILHSNESPMVVNCPFPSKEKKLSKVPRISRPGEELELGSPVTMRVRSVNGLQVFLAAPVNLQGHVHATQLVDVGDLGSQGSLPLARMQKSRALEARVLRLKRRGKVWHLELTCRPSLLKTSDVQQAMISWSNLKPQMTLAAAVVSVHKSHLWMEVAAGIKGRVALLDASNDQAVLRSLGEHFKAGQVFSARVLRVKGSHKELDLSLLPDMPQKKLLGQLTKVQEAALAATLQLPNKRWGAVHITELFDVWTKQPTQRLKVGSFYEVAVESDPNASGRVEVSLRSSKVRGTAEAEDERRANDVNDLSKASKVSGYVVSSGPQGVFVALSRTLTGRIPLKKLSDTHIMKESVSKLYPVGTLLRDVSVLEVKDSGEVELSLTSSTGLTTEQLSVGDLVSGKVKAVESFGLFIRLENSKIDGFVHKSEISDSASTGVESFKLGMRVEAKVLKIDGPKVGLTLKDLPEHETEDSEPELLELHGTKRKAEKLTEQKNDDDSEVEPWQSLQKGSGAAFEFAEFKVDSASSSDAEEEDEDEPKKLSKRQKKAIRKEEEKDLQKREAENADGRAADNPRSVEDFERLLLTQGDTSIVWIRYMAFHLKMSDLEKARQVAERAVKHVGFADSKERFNVWVAFMNLECSFGTEQSADQVFRRAASHNDAKQVHMQLARIHERNKKKQLAVKAYEACTRKFADSKKVWIAFLTFLYQNDDAEGARKLLPKSLAALPRRKHPVVVSKAAILEYQSGSPDRGRSIFEGLLDSYPKRTDLWAVYFDAHIKAFTPPRVSEPDFNEIRPLFQRCSTMSLKATKMRFFFKRWLDFETKWGDEQSQEDVRGKAREYVEGQA